MNTNDLIVDALGLPAALKQAGYPYVTINAECQWHIRIRTIDLFNVLEEVASLIARNNYFSPQHPLVRLLVDSMKTTGLVIDILNGTLRCSPNFLFVDKLNSFLQRFLDVVETDCLFKKQLSNLSRITIRNTESMKVYIDGLFDCYSRLLVVRVDFHYRKTEYDGLTLDRVTTDREIFLRITKRQFNSLVGLCWKLEYGKDRTFHYHMLFFFNGAEVRQDVTLGQQLGELWLSITNGDGTYFNCNTDKSRYEQCYLGQINYYDHNKRAALLQASYLTKTDENIIAVQLDGKCRIYGRMERPVRTSTAGRPRNHP